MPRLRADLARIRTNGFALNEGRSERGVVAIGRARSTTGEALAGLSIFLSSVRYDPHRLRSLVAALGFAATAIESELARA